MRNQKGLKCSLLLEQVGKGRKLIRKHKMQLMNSKTGKLLVKQMRKLLSLYLEKNNQVGLGAMEDLLHDVT
ncbi:uncharacterized protein DS421_16g543340 [Arachis hypogaea]|nr:uncharacterized protein DS421_16g543340 [Arachis hypogaea]